MPDQGLGANGRGHLVSRPATDLWRAGIVPAPISLLVEPQALRMLRDRIVWLPEPGPWRYLADPFGVRRGTVTHVFVEAFDYRTKHAVIEHHEFGLALDWRGKNTALSRPFHLSYPFVVEEGGEVFMVPESHRANEIALYRARKFPDDWVQETTLLPCIPGADASLIRFEGRWWMFYTMVGPKARDQRELHLAFANSLTGPWQIHSRNPVVKDRAGARPGGTPFIATDGTLTLPVQDCSQTYGGAIRFLQFKELGPNHVSCNHLDSILTGDLVAPTHCEGLHTLAKCGDLTFIDTKRIVRSWTRWGIDLQRRMVRLGQKFHA